MNTAETAGLFNNPSETHETIPTAESIVITTHFLYKNYQKLEGERSASDTDGIRGDLAIASIQRAINLGMRIVAADGGSSPDFLLALKHYEDHGLTITNSDVSMRGPQRRQAFAIAAELPDAKAIVYMQPEKANLLDFIPQITNPILQNTADIVIPARNPTLFNQSYPEYMRTSELYVNATYDWLMQRAGLMTKEQSFDWFFGPVVFKNDPEIIDLFLKKYAVDGAIYSRTGTDINPEMHSDGHYFPIIEALFKKKRVASIEVPFVYPSTQKANEVSPEMIIAFQNRRKADAAAYRLETIHFLAHLHGDPKSKIKEVY